MRYLCCSFALIFALCAQAKDKRSCEEIFKKKQNSLEGLVGLAKCHREKGEKLKALKALRKAELKFPGSDEVWKEMQEITKTR